MRKTTSKTEQKEVSPGLHLTLPAIVAEDLFTLVHSVGMQALQQLLEMERTQLCGPRYEHAQERAASRHGSTQGALVLGGRRVRLQRPRVRSRDGREVPLALGVSAVGHDRRAHPIQPHVLRTAGLVVRPHLLAHDGLIP